ncbi:pectin esterase [Candidatus Sumerlaeota bacterium]|nr:pectin esterase [Candidatus Sumerlaeota bacterium]
MRTLCAIALLSYLAAAPAAAKDLYVAQDGTAPFRTIQDAVAALPDNSPERTTVYIGSGTYQGPIVLPESKRNVTFLGQNTKTTVITYGFGAKDRFPRGQSDIYNGACVVVLANGFRAEKLTFCNTAVDRGAAPALRIEADRAMIRHCRVLGLQDTLVVNKGRMYFRDCYVEGQIDCISGSATVVFELCTIHSKDGGYITASATPRGQRFGFVFLRCRLSGVGESAYLGRPGGLYSNVVFLNCVMGSHIEPHGWDDSGDLDSVDTAYYGEYNSTGPGANRTKRVMWSRQLSRRDAQEITVFAVLRGSDGWDPDKIPYEGGQAW